MMPKKSKALLVLTTVAKSSDAARLSKILLEAKLAACVTTLASGKSRYRWKGKLCNEREWILLIKTSANKFAALEKKLTAIHPYECPEIVGLSVDKISRPYLDWLQKSLM